MKLKYFMTIPLGYLILFFSQRFGLYQSRYDMPVLLEKFIYVSLDIFAVLFFVYLYNKYVLKEQWSDIYVCRPAPSMKWIIIAFLLSTGVLCCCIFLTKGTFAKGDFSRESVIGAVSNTILSGGPRAGITEEVVFRGLIFSSLKKACGSKIAVIGSAVLFALMHLVNIDTSNLYNVISLLIAITISGIAFALIVLETGSIWSGVVFHGVYNIISGDLDILHVSVNQGFPAFWTYTPVREYRWITGIIGSDDIETGLPAMIGFIIVIIIALKSMEKKKMLNE